MALEVSVMPGCGLILIEAVTPKVILFSILTFGSFASPTPTLASLNSFPSPRAVWLVSWRLGSWSPSLGWARALYCRAVSFCLLCCFYRERGELDAGLGEGASLV